MSLIEIRALQESIVAFTQKMLAPLQRRVSLMVSRCVIVLVNDALKMQGVQVNLMADVTRDGVERFQNYGLTSNPHPGAEGVMVSVGGNQDHGIVIAVDDRRYRLIGLTEGEVALYDDIGQKVYLTRTGIVVHSTLITLDAPTVHATGDLNVDGNINGQKNIVAQLDITDSAATSPKTMAAMRTAHNGHAHPENNVAGGNTNGPTVSM